MLPLTCQTLEFKVPSLVKKYYTAAETKPIMDDIFQSLTESLEDDQVTLWEGQEANALALRGEAMRIFDLQLQKGEEYEFTQQNCTTDRVYYQPQAVLKCACSSAQRRRIWASQRVQLL